MYLWIACSCGCTDMHLDTGVTDFTFKALANRIFTDDARKNIDQEYKVDVV